MHRDKGKWSPPCRAALATSLARPGWSQKTLPPHPMTQTHASENSCPCTSTLPSGTTIHLRSSQKPLWMLHVERVFATSWNQAGMSDRAPTMTHPSNLPPLVQRPHHCHGCAASGKVVAGLCGKQGLTPAADLQLGDRNSEKLRTTGMIQCHRRNKWHDEMLGRAQQTMA